MASGDHIEVVLAGATGLTDEQLQEICAARCGGLYVPPDKKPQPKTEDENPPKGKDNE
jgi:hypothetical protein